REPDITKLDAPVVEILNTLDVDDTDATIALTFMTDNTGRIFDNETGSEWNIFGTAISGPLTGVELFQELAGTHFWFAWAAFRPETAVYGIE
ncbi:MAG: DUF3179 domain-containing (seleno)protein, partial [Chloroflexota bacterium]